MRYDEPKGLLEWSFSELLTANVSLWNQYKYIAFNISSCKILIISYKMLIIAGFCKKKKKKKTNQPYMEHYVEASQYFTDKN